MAVKAGWQDKGTFCEAIFNRNMDRIAMCPANYDIEYRRGWFYYTPGSRVGEEEVPQRVFRDPEITAEADRLMQEGHFVVGYSRVWNQYVLIPSLPD